MCPPYPQRDRKRRLIGAVCRNHRIKRLVPCRCLDGHVKEPYEMSMALGARPLVLLLQYACTSMCCHIYDWNIVNCDVKQPIQLNNSTQSESRFIVLRYTEWCHTVWRHHTAFIIFVKCVKRTFFSCTYFQSVTRHSFWIIWQLSYFLRIVVYYYRNSGFCKSLFFVAAPHLDQNKSCVKFFYSLKLIKNA